jgi:hypothetical protein
MAVGMMDTAVTASDALAVSFIATGIVETPTTLSDMVAVSLSATCHVRAAGAQNGVVQNALSANSIIPPLVKVGCPPQANEGTRRNRDFADRVECKRHLIIFQQTAGVGLTVDFGDIVCTSIAPQKR